MSKYLAFCPNPKCDAENIPTGDAEYGGKIHCPKCGCEIDLAYESSLDGESSGTFVESYRLKDA